MTVDRRAWGVRIGPGGPLVVIVCRPDGLGFQWLTHREPGSIPYAGHGPEFAVDLDTVFGVEQ